MNHHTENELENTKQAVIPGQCVRFSPDTAHVTIPRRGFAEPKVELIKSGDRIRAIDITCSCGQRIRLRCDYAS